jgi:hypothetical protein
MAALSIMISEPYRHLGEDLSLPVALSVIYDDNCYGKRKRYPAMPKTLPRDAENATPRCRKSYGQRQCSATMTAALQQGTPAAVITRRLTPPGCLGWLPGAGPA